MKYSIYIIALIALLVGCKNSSEEQASGLLDEARSFADLRLYDQSINLIDSIGRTYPSAYNQKFMAERLLDTIIRKQNTLKLDSLSNLQNEYRGLIYEPELSIVDRNIILAKIDSLDKEKIPFRLIIRHINDRESLIAATCQCRTAMRNR